MVGPPNEIPEGKFSDLNMLVQYAALERTCQEFRDLLKSGGFEMTEVIPTRSPLSIIVAQPMVNALSTIPLSVLGSRYGRWGSTDRREVLCCTAKIDPQPTLRASA